jgi:hypothetical protein
MTKSNPDDRIFITHDLSLAAYLLMKGLILKSARKIVGKFEFQFMDPDDISDALSLEFIGSDFAVYDGYIRTLRGILNRK